MSVSIQQCGDVQVEINNGNVKLKGKIKTVKINGNEVVENEVSSYENSMNKFSFGFFSWCCNYVFSSLIHSIYSGLRYE